MVKNFEDVQQYGKENLDATMKSFGAFSKSAQAIAVELADYSKKVFEQGTAASEKLIGAKSLEKAFEVQSEFVKSSYEGFVAEATKLGELYADLAKEAYKPFEGQFGKVAATKYSIDFGKRLNRKARPQGRAFFLRYAVGAAQLTSPPAG
jgi:hypothetical protein